MLAGWAWCTAGNHAPSEGVNACGACAERFSAPHDARWVRVAGLGTMRSSRSTSRARLGQRQSIRIAVLLGYLATACLVAPFHKHHGASAVHQSQLRRAEHQPPAGAPNRPDYCPICTFLATPATVVPGAEPPRAALVVETPAVAPMPPAQSCVNAPRPSRAPPAIS